MPTSDAVAYVHGSGQNAFDRITYDGTVWGDPICQAGSQFSNLELDNGKSSAVGTSYPFIPAFPSVNEMLAANPAEVLGDSGSHWGLNVRIMSSFNNLTSIQFQVCTSPTTAAPNTNPIAARSLTLAQMSDVGTLYFVPVPQAAVLRFTRFYASLTGSNPTTGTLVAWLGPKEAGAQ